MESQREYEARERRDFWRDIVDIEKDSLPDRQMARDDYYTSMAHDPGTVAERVDGLLAGNYGKGSYDIAWEIAKNTRMNREAALWQIVAVLEWRCPRDFARQAWNKLTSAQKKRLNSLIKHEITWHLREAKKEGGP